MVQHAYPEESYTSIQVLVMKIFSGKIIDRGPTSKTPIAVIPIVDASSMNNRRPQVSGEPNRRANSLTWQQRCSGVQRDIAPNSMNSVDASSWSSRGSQVSSELASRVSSSG
ncbi:hypothetical protein Tco_0685120 [Tanacetum coccineum]